MMPSGPPTPIGGAQSINPSLLRNNSGRLAPGGQVGSVGSQPSFPSLVSQRAQFGNNGNMSMLGSISNVNSLINHSFGNGGLDSGVGNSSVTMNLQQRSATGSGSAMDMAGFAESDPFSCTSSGQAQSQNFQNPPGSQLGMEHSQAQQVEASQSFHQQFSVPQGQQQPARSGLGNAASVKLEQQQSSSDQCSSLQQTLSLRNLSAVKLEPQQLQSMRNLGPVKLEQHEHLDSSLFLQRQQQQQLLHSSRQSSQAAVQMNLLQQQQRIVQMQQQQQQLLRTFPPQRPQLQQQQLQQQALSLVSQAKPAAYEPGICARRLTHYMYHQQHRPADNNIDFWRKFVNEYFAPHAKKRWCVSLYGSGRQTSGVFPQDVWHCEICNRKPGRGFETTVEVLPRLLKIKYDSGTLEELLYVDMPREYQNSSGQIVLDYAKAIQESVFEQLRVVRDGQLRVVFSSDLKICSWEFCARRHEELIPRRLIVPQVSQLGSVAQKYQTSAHNASTNTNLSAQDLQNTCNSFVASARQMAKSLEVPLVNDLGYTKRYVRCLQISEVVNSMKDLIDFSRETGTGPMTSLINFPRRTMSSGLHMPPAQQPQEQQPITHSLNHNDVNSSQTSGVQISAIRNGAMCVSNILGPMSSTTSASTIAGLLHQNSMNSRQENPTNNASSPYGGGNIIQIPSASSSSLPQSQPNPSSPFPCATSSTPNNRVPQSSHNISHLNPTNSAGNVSSMQQQASQSNDELNDTQSSMHQIIQEMMMSSQCNGPSVVNDMKGVSGISQALSGGNCLAGNGGVSHNMSIGGMGFGTTGGIGTAVTASGIRSALANNTRALNMRVGMNPMAQDPSLNHHQQDLASRLLTNGLGTANSFHNRQFDWKHTP